ncbi:hypothetical protein LX36DRAFT_106177 [Colletotrichum falcatum]|nr:hypothetical protein LX36DRAFT_106177 [Colletotrichum falcatum]
MCWTELQRITRATARQMSTSVRCQQSRGQCWDSTWDGLAEHRLGVHRNETPGAESTIENHTKHVILILFSHLFLLMTWTSRRPRNQPRQQHHFVTILHSVVGSLDACP